MTALENVAVPNNAMQQTRRQAVIQATRCPVSLSALRWALEALGRGAEVRTARPLAGATSSALYGVEVERGGHSFNLVLRLFVDEGWLRLEPDLALHEAASLRKAARAGVHTPELIAFDEDGRRAGFPAVLMTRLPGAVELRPANLDRWLSQLAEAIAPVHAVEAGTHPWLFSPYNDIFNLQPPAWSKFPKLWEKAFEVVTGPRPQARERFIHRDFHPNNVVWEGGRVTGVVDWVNACRGPAGFDLAWCRLNLAKLCGPSAADRFLRAYQSLAGASSEYHPYWDLLAATECVPGPPDVYEGWVACGVKHLSDELMRERVDEYLVSVLARL